MTNSSQQQISPQKPISTRRPTSFRLPTPSREMVIAFAPTAVSRLGTLEITFMIATSEKFYSKAASRVYMFGPGADGAEEGERGFRGSPLTRTVTTIAKSRARHPTPSIITYLSLVRNYIDCRRSCCLRSAVSWEMDHFTPSYYDSC